MSHERVTPSSDTTIATVPAKPTFTFKPSRKDILKLITEAVNTKIAGLREQYEGMLRELQAKIKARIFSDTVTAIESCKSASADLKALDKLAQKLQSNLRLTIGQKQVFNAQTREHEYISELCVTLDARLPIPSGVKINLNHTPEEQAEIDRLNTIIYGGRRGRGQIDEEEISEYLMRSDPETRAQVEQTAALIVTGITAAAEKLMAGRQ